MSYYAELQVTTHFSFLRGASSPRRAVRARPKLLGIEAVGVVGRNSLAGIVRALEASQGRRAFGWSSAAASTCSDGMSILSIPPTAQPIRG